ncbi:DUF3152 domain-containing protein [Nocardioides nanhaiensis]|uniref:DUF3152 domain-containing protein n=1 Tax=Nocardioides nanhaiensis TaxID=1476871 RepID=A0ABP8W3B9_9ACTN
MTRPSHRSPRVRHPLRARLARLAALVVLLGGLAAVTTAAQAAAPVNTAPPTVSGTPAVDGRLVASPGAWSPSPSGRPLGYAYRWLRDGDPIRGAVERSYRPGVADQGARLTVRVTATDPSDPGAGSGVAESAPTARVQRGTMTNRRPPVVIGEQRYERTLRVTAGRWSTTPTRLRYQWLRAGKPIRGATGARYRLGVDDVGQRVRVLVTATAPGYTRGTARSARTGPVDHRVGVRRVATYSIVTRGRIGVSVREFARQAAETFADPRGWRGGGVAFRRVPRGGGFTLVLAEASTVPSFSSGCSAEYSCRVGRFVIINQTRWRLATAPWRAAGGSLREYRHMVVNHEVGHWLGRGHAGCSGRGRLAPVMMQQSKGLDGCRFNPWPLRSEY